MIVLVFNNSKCLIGNEKLSLMMNLISAYRMNLTYWSKRNNSFYNKKLPRKNNMKLYFKVKSQRTNNYNKPMKPYNKRKIKNLKVEDNDILLGFDMLYQVSLAWLVSEGSIC